MTNRNVTIKDIAREAGVSVSTVSRAINNSGRIDAKTKERVEQIIKTLGYSPNTAAQSLKTQRTRNIVLIVPDITNPFYSNLAKELQILVKSKNYILTLFNTNENLSEEMCAIASAKEISAGGIVFASVSEQRCIVETLLSLGIPSVLLNSYAACELDCVHGANKLGTYIAAKHLLEAGHRKIAFIGGSRGTRVATSRKEGYVHALMEAGISIDENLLFEMGFSEDVGYKGAKYLSTISPLPTAICCANDIIAMGVLSALHEMKIPVPDQISVTGMDDIIYSRISSPPLTSVTNDSKEFARESFRLLFERIENNEDIPPREIIIGRQLVERESVAKLL